MSSSLRATWEARFLALAEQLSPHLNGPTAHRLAGAVEACRGNLESENLNALDMDDRKWIEDASSSIVSDRIRYWSNRLNVLSTHGVRLVVISDPEYPLNLLSIHNPPPLLFVRGNLHENDVRAIAVVGARSAGTEGLEIARELSRALVNRDVVVISGLAAGVDTAAHQGALDGHGRTIAVFGTGIEQVYPVVNRDLADQVAGAGACISQFWPQQSPTRWTFPVRNIVTSGLSLATVVVEAGETSGARLQAMEALKHGKRVVLMKHLVDRQQWARDLVVEPAVAMAMDVEDVLKVVDAELVATLPHSVLSM